MIRISKSYRNLKDSKGIDDLFTFKINIDSQIQNMGVPMNSDHMIFINKMSNSNKKPPASSQVSLGSYRTWMFSSPSKLI